MCEKAKILPPASLLEALDRQRGRRVERPNGCTLFSFYSAGEAANLIRDWHREIGIEDFLPVGSLCCGDFVCAHPSGILFVVDHDNFEWWDSDVSFDELLRRLDAMDEDLEEDIYFRNQNT